MERITGHPILLTPGTEQYTQWYHRDIAGRPIMARDLPLTRAVRQGETIMAAPLCYARPDGQQVVVNVSAAPIRDSGGRITHAVMVVMDSLPAPALADSEMSVCRLDLEIQALVEVYRLAWPAFRYWVDCSPFHLEHRRASYIVAILRELLHNAIVSTRSEIIVALTHTPRYLELEVIDDGPGLTTRFSGTHEQRHGLHLVHTILANRVPGRIRYLNRRGGLGGRVLLTFALPFAPVQPVQPVQPLWDPTAPPVITTPWRQTPRERSRRSRRSRCRTGRLNRRG